MNKRREIQIISLITFITIILLGKMQLWLIIFLVSLVLSTYFGRFYCGYICPINTGIELTSKKVSKGKETPSFFKKPIVRYIILVLCLLTMFFVMRTGKKLPILLILFILGLVLTIFYKPSFWHRYLCPYGTLLSLFSKYNRKTYKVYKDECIKCLMCTKVCPADAYKIEDGYPEIIKNECLQCAKCVEVCPKNTIK